MPPQKPKRGDNMNEKIEARKAMMATFDKAYELGVEAGRAMERAEYERKRDEFRRSRAVNLPLEPRRPAPRPPIGSLRAVDKNEERRQVIESSKAFVKSTIEPTEKRYNSRLDKYEYGFRHPNGHSAVKAKFEVDVKRRTVKCVVRGIVSEMGFGSGTAVCNDSDVFNVHIGREIALRRALGMAVPYRLYNAPNPNKRVVGMLVETMTDYLFAYGGPIRKGETYKIIPSSHQTKNGRRECQLGSGMASSGRILDDTNAVYENTTSSYGF